MDEAQARVQALDTLLQEEFEALRSQSFDRLDALQSEKMALLDALQATATQVAALPQIPAPWNAVLEALAQCREAYRRNELLVTRQLEAVGATLRSLQSADTAAPGDLYEHLGPRARRAYSLT